MPKGLWTQELADDWVDKLKTEHPSIKFVVSTLENYVK